MLTLSVYLVGGNPETNGSLAIALERHARVKVVATARDEPGAMQWLTQRLNDADLVIVDLFLNAGSGLGVLRRSRATQHGRNVVVLSDFAGGDLRRTCMALGAARVFDKTTEFDSLLAYCENLADSITFH
jgi:DNA-binding NarL/FixJ family response regulator